MAGSLKGEWALVLGASSGFGEAANSCAISGNDGR